MKTKINIMLFRFYFLIFSVILSYGANAVVNCEDLQLNALTYSAQNVTSNLYPQEKNLVKFTFKFIMDCGFRAAQIYFPQKAVVEALVNNLYKPNMITPVERTIVGKEEHISFITRNYMFNNLVAFDARHLLRYDTKYIHMQNSMEFATPILYANGEFAGLKNISWFDSCQQESAGWCFVWDGAFEITWAFDGQNFNEFENRIKNYLAPKIFEQTYLKYSKFVAQEALK